MKNVLWISRHEMTTEQKRDLERGLASPVTLHSWKNTTENLKVLEPLIQKADAIAAVLPTPLLAELVAIAQGKPVLVAINLRKSTGQYLTTDDGRREEVFTFVHGGWNQILRLEVEVRRL